MAAPEISDEKLKETVDCFEKIKGSTRRVASELGISEGAVRTRIKKAKLRGLIEGEKEPESKPPFWIDDLPDDDIAVEDLVKQGVERWERKERSYNARKLINVNLYNLFCCIFNFRICNNNCI